MPGSQVIVVVRPDAEIVVTDDPTTNWTEPMRRVSLAMDNVRLETGIFGYATDRELVAFCDKMAAAFRTIRENAARRLTEREDAAKSDHYAYPHDAIGVAAGPGGEA